MRRESGATLVEAVVATVLLSAGIVAVLGAERAATRLESIGRWSAIGADRAAEAVGTLAADPCALAEGSSTMAGSPAVSWSLDSSGPLRTVGVVVAYPPASGRQPALFATGFLCGRP